LLLCLFHKDMLEVVSLEQGNVHREVRQCHTLVNTKRRVRKGLRVRCGERETESVDGGLQISNGGRGGGSGGSSPFQFRMESLQGGER
jgi:hypothetical protein